MWDGTKLGCNVEHVVHWSSGPTAFLIQDKYWVRVPFYAITPLVLSLPTLAWRRHRHERRAGRENRCSSCGYDLRAASDRCPECGKVPSSTAITVAR